MKTQLLILLTLTISCFAELAPNQHYTGEMKTDGSVKAEAEVILKGLSPKDKFTRQYSLDSRSGTPAHRDHHQNHQRGSAIRLSRPLWKQRNRDAHQNRWRSHFHF